MQLHPFSRAPQDVIWHCAMSLTVTSAKGSRYVQSCLGYLLEKGRQGPDALNPCSYFRMKGPKIKQKLSERSCNIVTSPFCAAHNGIVPSTVLTLTPQCNFGRPSQNHPCAQTPHIQMRTIYSFHLPNLKMSIALTFVRALHKLRMMMMTFLGSLVGCAFFPHSELAIAGWFTAT